MMNRTKIEWVKNPDGTQGYTWNPITGCLNGCEYCYARRLAHGRLKERYLANRNIAPSRSIVEQIAPQIALSDPFYPRFWNNRLLDGRDELCNANPRGIFVCDMSDLFGIGIPEEWTRRVMDIIKSRSQHRFYLLTKQLQNLIKFSPFPENCWVGVTATNRQMLFMAMHYLEDIQAKAKYISIEPMLERCYSLGLDSNLRASVDWLIIGAQTKPYKPPKIEWIEEIVKAADKAGVPVFLKDNLIPLLAGSPDSRKAKLFYSEMGLRQEMPSG